MARIRNFDRESQVQRPNHYTTEPPTGVVSWSIVGGLKGDEGKEEQEEEEEKEKKNQKKREKKKKLITARTKGTRCP